MVKKPKRVPCKCIELVNKQLADMNACIDTEFIMDFESRTAELVMKIPLKKLESSRKPLPTMLVQFCPICGEKMRLETKKAPTKKKGRRRRASAGRER